MSDPIKELAEKLAQFAKERDWEQFHSPKNLVMALSGEVGELNEVFQWLTEAQSQTANLSPKQLAGAKEEIADVFLYLVRLADKLNVDIVAEANNKIQINAGKYPVSLSKGSAVKYDKR